MTSDTPIVSIVICTRNHASALRPTLESLSAVHIPEDLSTELIIADNGSTDNTVQVVAEATPWLKNLTGGVHRVEAPDPGQCYARNAGIAAARGKIIVFTDDDLRFPTDWIEGICRPILMGDADAVVGGVRLAPHLERPWMSPDHRTWLACTDRIQTESPWLVGANFAFSQHVLTKVPSFDTELGPGRLGFGDDTLFGEQLREAGYKIVARLDTVVEHHCDADRLLRSSYLSSAEKMGRSLAYRAYHWYHEEQPSPGRQRLRNQILLALRRLTRRRDMQAHEGMPFWEMHYVQFCHFYDQWEKEAQRPRLYERRGLVKKSG